ncbi:Phosphopantetheine attachment site, partial [Asanoa hainanensis]
TLGLPNISVDDNFFALGGTSLQAARTVLALRTRCGVEVSVGDFYAAVSVADIARRIDAAREQLNRSRTPVTDNAAEEIAALERRLAEARAALEGGTTASDNE